MVFALNKKCFIKRAWGYVFLLTVIIDDKNGIFGIEFPYTIITYIPVLIGQFIIDMSQDNKPYTFHTIDI